MGLALTYSATCLACKLPHPAEMERYRRMTLALETQTIETLLADSVYRAIRRQPEEYIHGVTRNEASLADTTLWAETYGISLDQTANVVVVETRKTRNAERQFAAVLVLADSRADLNGSVKKLLEVSKVSFAPADMAVEVTGMESGGMSPIGLPDTWPLLVDSRVVDVEKLYVGSGNRSSKLVIDGRLVQLVPNAIVATDIGLRV